MLAPTHLGAELDLDEHISTGADGVHEIHVLA